MDGMTMLGFIGSGIGIISGFVTTGVVFGVCKQKLEALPGMINKVDENLTEKINGLDKRTDERLDSHDQSIKELFESRYEQTNAITNLSVNITFFKEQLSDVKNNINQINTKLDAILQELSKKGV